MLKKIAKLSVSKDEDGWDLFDEKTKDSVKIMDETTLELTLIVWEVCGRLDPAEIVDHIIGPADATTNEKKMIKKVVDDTLRFFLESGWAVEKPIKKAKK